MKIAIVTGASRGIGKSIALNIAKRGVGVILTYNGHSEEGHAVAEEIKKLGGKAVALKFDSSMTNTFNEFAKEVEKNLEQHFGRNSFDYLVNNAGISGARGPILETTEEQFTELVNINLKGPFFLTQKLVPLMAEGGHIINISSGLTRFSYPNVAVYGSLKCALEGFTRYFAKEFASRKIRANSVAPGAIDTDFGGGKDPIMKKGIGEMTALGKIGEAEDVGVFVASLLSDDSRFLNAQRIEVSGGIYI
ncbi:MAG: SDR family oxidoreductase [Bacteriovorax sp.]|nr:SDR family oxidoreductase [Bacteriovorax sp.]